MDPVQHPPPPSELNKRSLPIVTIEDPWIRFFRKNKNALYFGKEDNYRFNAPNREFGTLYLGEDAHAAFIESFGWNTGKRAITNEELSKKHLAQVSSSRPLRCVDLTGSGLAKIGADARICVGEDYSISKKWSLAFCNHPDNPDGIYYPVRHDPERKALALFDRNNLQSTLSYIDTGPLSHPGYLPLRILLLEHYNFDLV